MGLCHAVVGICSNSTGYAKYGNLSDWDTSLITNMFGAFFSKDKFKGDIRLWNTSSVATMVGQCKSSVHVETHVETTGTRLVCGFNA